MSHDNSMVPRRDFLKALSAGTVVLGGSGLLEGCAPHHVSPSSGATAAVASSHMPTPNAEWDMSWLDRMTRPHKIVFDNPLTVGGAVISQAENWMVGYAAAYGAKDADLNPVLVIRHSSVPMVLSNAMWKRLGLTEEQPQLKPLIDRGAIVLACNFALRAQANKLTKEGIKEDEAYKQIRAAVMPGVYVMPNGIFAVGRAQEAGCGYFRAGG